MGRRPVHRKRRFYRFSSVSPPRCAVACFRKPSPRWMLRKTAIRPRESAPLSKPPRGVSVSWPIGTKRSYIPTIGRSEWRRKREVYRGVTFRTGTLRGHSSLWRSWSTTERDRPSTSSESRCALPDRVSSLAGGGGNRTPYKRVQRTYRKRSLAA